MSRYLHRSTPREVAVRTAGTRKMNRSTRKSHRTNEMERLYPIEDLLRFFKQKNTVDKAKAYMIPRSCYFVKFYSRSNMI